MDFDYGGPSSPQDQHESAAEIARKKVLAAYSSTVENLKNLPASARDALMNDNGDTASTTPSTDPYSSENYPYDTPDYADTAPSVDQSTEYTEYAEPYPPDETGALKDTPVNQAYINDEWQKYHSAWQDYYKNYYSEYYAKAAESYLATEKLKNERIATGEVRRRRNHRKLIPVGILLFIILTGLFLQYNRMIFAPLMAYVSPDSGSVPTSLEPVDPTITQAVSPEPRLIIPKLNVDVPVAFGISTNDVDAAMNEGVAQFSIPGANALPGQIGNLVITGHSAGDIYSNNPYKFIFSGLERLENGDLIYVNYNSVRYTYQMVGRETVEPSNVGALIYETDKPMLTLITCTPLGTSRYRLLISAEQISPSYNDAEIAPPSEETPSSSDDTMPANEPSFFERLFGN